MKTTFKLLAALGAITLGLATSNVYGQANGANGAMGRRGAAGAMGAAGAAGAGRGLGANAYPTPPTIDALTTALTLTPDEVKSITPILADMTKAQADIVKAAADYQTARTANIEKISATLTDTQKALLQAQFAPAIPGGRRGAAGAMGAMGAMGRRGGMGNGAAPAPAPAAGPAA